MILQKDEWHAGFNGEMIAWVANFGKGAYRESHFDEEDLPLLHYGYSMGHSDLKYF
jgi:hypothetical protein